MKNKLLFVLTVIFVWLIVGFVLSVDFCLVWLSILVAIIILLIGLRFDYFFGDDE